MLVMKTWKKIEKKRLKEERNSRCWGSMMAARWWTAHVLEDVVDCNRAASEVGHRFFSLLFWFLVFFFRFFCCFFFNFSRMFSMEFGGWTRRSLTFAESQEDMVDVLSFDAAVAVDHRHVDVPHRCNSRPNCGVIIFVSFIESNNWRQAKPSTTFLTNEEMRVWRR